MSLKGLAGTKRKRSGSISTQDSRSDQQRLQEALRTHLENGERVVFVTGAGISVPSGIPPYRGASNAVWEASVQEWGTRSRFLQDPLVWYNQFWLPKFTTWKVRSAQPNDAHFVISRLQQRFPNLLVITQNMDTLHTLAGTPASQFIQVHGQLGLYRCTNSNCPHAQSEPIRLDEEQVISLLAQTGKKSNLSPFTMKNAWKWKECPHCSQCNSVLMPLTLMFDEEYESHSFYQIKKTKKWLGKCKLLVFIGTSHAVNVTRMAEQLGYSNGAALYNINLRDTVHGMCNILGRAEKLLPSLVGDLLTNTNSTDTVPALRWECVDSLERKTALAKSQVVQGVFYNRTITLGLLCHPHCGQVFLARGDSEGDSPASQTPDSSFAGLLTLSGMGLGSLVGNQVLDQWNESFYQFLLDAGRHLHGGGRTGTPSRIQILCIDYLHSLDPKASARNISRMDTVPTVPRQLSAFLQRKLNATDTSQASGDESSEEESSEDKGDEQEPVESMVIRLAMAFYLNEEKWDQLTPNRCGVGKEINPGEFGYSKSRGQKKTPLRLLEVDQVLFDQYLSIHPSLRFNFPTSHQFFAAGGFGHALMYGDQLVSACVTALTCDETVHADVYTVEEFRRRGFATACSYLFMRSCFSRQLRPEWCCQSDNIAALRIGLKLGFVASALIPVLSWKPKSVEESEQEEEVLTIGDRGNLCS